MASTADAGGKYETVEMDDKTSADEVTEESTTVTVTTTAEHRRKQPFAAMQQGMQKGATQTVAVVSGAFSDFVRFLKRGNVFDLAVGVVMGSAFTAIVNSFVSDLITPIIALAIQSNLEHAFIVIRCKTFPNNSTKVDPTCTEGNQANYTTVAVANAAGAVTWNWGNFIQICINFLVTGFFVYILVKAYSATFLPAILAPPGPKMRNCEFCLESINAKAKKCKFCTSPNEVQVEVVAVETSPFANLRFPRVPHMTDVFHKKAASSSSGGSGSPGGPGPSGGTPM
ncbi:hypothetical protein HK101_007990 [Irineochytrium annulatum]|nr:hypothetical protein HK101_007990 [Irineochytrium annulatum]